MGSADLSHLESEFSDTYGPKKKKILTDCRYYRSDFTVGKIETEFKRLAHDHTSIAVVGGHRQVSQLVLSPLHC